VKKKMEQSLIEQQSEWRNNLRFMRNLRQEIDQGFGKSCVERNLNEFVEGLLEKYNIDNVSFMLKSVINNASWDGRYDKSVKEWAEIVELFPQPPGRPMDDRQFSERFYLEAHPCYINEMANRIIKIENSIIQTKDDRMMGDR